MELCQALTHVYGHNNWWNPIRGIGSVGGFHQSPYQAYLDLDEPFQRIVVSLFGFVPDKNSGLTDDYRPIDFTKYHNYAE